MKKDFVSIGTKVTLENEENRDVFHSVVQEVDGKKNFKINALTKYGVFVKLPIGTQLMATYMSGVSGFEFLAEIVSNEKLGNLNVVNMKRISEIWRNQKREHFRVEVLLPVKVKVYDMFDVTQVIRSYDTTTYDLSEKGLGILYDQPLDYNQFVDVYLEIEGAPVELRCNVARSFKDEDAPAGIHRYRVGLYLLEEDEKIQKKIRQFVYRLQVNH